MKHITSLFNPPSVPAEYRRNFIHLYFDIAWYGLLAGSAVNFLTVYAARLGASGLQIGLLGALTAAVNLVLAIPAGRWLEKRSVDKAIFWTAAAYRAGYIAWVFLPFIFGANSQGEIWALIFINFLMGIPLTVVGLGFNALFAAAVPSEWRAHVAGTRNVVLSVTFILTSLVSGYILDRAAFPLGYQIVFLIGVVGGAMSSFHLWFVRPLPRPDSRAEQASHEPVSPLSEPESASPASPAPGTVPVSRATSPRESIRASLRLDILKSPFRAVLLVMFAFHLSQFLAIPLFPIAYVRSLRLTDEHIGIGTAIFYLTVLVGSTQLNRLVRRAGHKNITGWGVMGMAVYPFLLALSSTVWHFYGLSALGGLAWALAGGAYANYLLENIPENDRPAHLAWYTIVLNACTLLGSLAGPAIAEWIGLSAALILFGALRGLAGFAILRWG